MYPSLISLDKHSGRFQLPRFTYFGCQSLVYFKVLGGDVFASPPFSWFFHEAAAKRCLPLFRVCCKYWYTTSITLHLNRWLYNGSTLAPRINCFQFDWSSPWCRILWLHFCEIQLANLQQAVHKENILIGWVPSYSCYGNKGD